MMLASDISAALAEAIQLEKAAKIPLYTSLASFTWVLHDFLLTVGDEAKYVWPGPWNIGKILFFWVRYYTIALALFDVAQIHSFSTFQPSLTTCVVMDAMIRVVGALSLWAIEIVMQLRIYALFRCSKKVAAFNALLFLASIGGFLYILIHNALVRASVISQAKSLPIPGCPVVHTGIEWAQWVPATVYEGVLFAFALAKSINTLSTRIYKRNGTSEELRPTLYSVVLQDNLLYFFGITCILVFNNLMVVSVTHIPWFSYGPFHAATGIMTIRLLIHLRKALVQKSQTGINPRSGREPPSTAQDYSWRIAIPNSSSSEPSSAGTQQFDGPIEDPESSDYSPIAPKKSDAPGKADARYIVVV